MPFRYSSPTPDQCSPSFLLPSLSREAEGQSRKTGKFFQTNVSRDVINPQIKISCLSTFWRFVCSSYVPNAWPYRADEHGQIHEIEREGCRHGVLLRVSQSAGRWCKGSSRRCHSEAGWTAATKSDGLASSYAETWSEGESQSEEGIGYLKNRQKVLTPCHAGAGLRCLCADAYSSLWTHTMLTSRTFYLARRAFQRPRVKNMV